MVPPFHGAESTQIATRLKASAAQPTVPLATPSSTATSTPMEPQPLESALTIALITHHSALVKLRHASALIPRLHIAVAALPC